MACQIVSIRDMAVRGGFDLGGFDLDMRNRRSGYWSTEETAASAFSVMIELAGRPEIVGNPS